MTKYDQFVIIVKNDKTEECLSHKQFRTLSDAIYYAEEYLYLKGKYKVMNKGTWILKNEQERSKHALRFRD